MLTFYLGFLEGAVGVPCKNGQIYLNIKLKHINPLGEPFVVVVAVVVLPVCDVCEVDVVEDGLIYNILTISF